LGSALLSPFHCTYVVLARRAAPLLAVAELAAPGPCSDHHHP